MYQFIARETEIIKLRQRDPKAFLRRSHDMEITSHDMEITRLENYDIEIPRPKSCDIEFMWNYNPFVP